MRVFRKSTPEDIEAMMTIVTDGQALLKSRGIDQWQKGYPNRDLLIADVREGIGYVVTEEERVAAMCAVTFTDEESYRKLDEGAWLTPDGSLYATIHRGAVARACQGKGYPSFLFSEVGKLAKARGAESVRADTHPQNIAMQKALEKAGFVRCGVLTLIGGSEDGDLRIGYEKRVSAF
ncbi:MAG: GNAT family N-acetyltransferase [Lachnospiraceae bacterium]|nr:GNAT family N-acetyltransferase [Lachnospiraceae bacterium]